MATHSIRRTLLIRCGAGSGLLLMALSISVYFMVRHALYEEIDQSLTETASILANQMEFEHGSIIFEWQEGIGTNSEIADKAFFQYWNEKSGAITRSPALGIDDLVKFSGPNGNPHIQTIAIAGRMDHARAIGMVIYPYLNPEETAAGIPFDPKAYPHTLVLARDLTHILKTLTNLAGILSIGTIVTFIVGFLIIRHAVRFSLAPIDSLTLQVRNRSESQLESAIILPGSLPSELVPLAESFDTLLTRVAAIRSRERDFIRHASHELRTPIASLSATTELALSKPRKAVEYVRHLQSCASTSHQLNELVKRLSGLARIGQYTSTVKIQSLSASDAINLSIANFSQRVTDGTMNISIAKSGRECVVEADPILLDIILNNMFDNAISYSADGSTIQIETSCRDFVEISVTNPSTDLPEDLDRLFEPLFRRDPSRQETASSHLGIGLTLSREAANAMGGSLSAARMEPGLIRFTLSLRVGK